MMCIRWHIVLSLKPLPWKGKIHCFLVKMKNVWNKTVYSQSLIFVVDSYPGICTYIASNFMVATLTVKDFKSGCRDLVRAISLYAWLGSSCSNSEDIIWGFSFRIYLLVAIWQLSAQPREQHWVYFFFRDHSWQCNIWDPV